ncbi:MAG TPA: PDZ domain-containing protein, partial [Gemmataceae bacterium]|nr:PDZ domain-containing protein [Gemmataceae bacterium]
MRRRVIALGWLLCPAGLLAAPAPAGHSPSAAAATQAEIQAAAAEYARNLYQVVETIERSYVREVRRADLSEAALTGLYEAARVPVPATLHSALAKAEKGGAFDVAAALLRADLGNPEAIQGRRGLLVSCRAMMRLLDPFCAVVTDKEAIATGFEQNYGLGIDVVEKAGPGPLLIKAVVPGGPAQRAGLQAGDHILRVDDKETTKYSTRDALIVLNGGAQALDDLPPPIPPPPGGVEPASA